ncbi:Exosome component 10, partial [Taenia solium]
NAFTPPHFSSPTERPASKFIVRPQDFFTIRPDNSHAPFVPTLRSKPSAIPISPVVSDCTSESDPETGDYVHLYLSELEAYGKGIGQYRYDSPALNPRPPPLNETLLDITDTVDGLSSMLVDLVQQHRSYRTFLGMTCLIQLSTRTKDCIVDALALHDYLSQLNGVFTNPRVVKMLHGSNMDLLWLQRDFGVRIVNLFDTGQAARTLRFPRFSLAYPLQNYAWSDTHYLLNVAEVLRGLPLSQDLLTDVYMKLKFNLLEYLSKLHAVVRESLDKRQLYALKYLCIFVLPNHMLYRMAERLLISGMYACYNRVAPLLHKYLPEFHQIVLNARNGKQVEQKIEADMAIVAQFKAS